MKKASKDEIDQRKNKIMEAALFCFLNVGYAKTSMNDVAERAKLSRPLLYLNFKNKVDLLQALYEYLMDGRVERAETALQSKGSRQERLFEAIHILVIEPWKKISDFPKSFEFFETCGQYNQKNYEHFEKKQLKLFEAFFEDKTVAEVFTLAANGAMEDLPTSAILRKRLMVLVEKFA